jgi:hypothetical protein
MGWDGMGWILLTILLSTYWDGMVDSKDVLGWDVVE